MRCTVKANPTGAFPPSFQGTEQSHGNVFDIMDFTDLTISSIDLNIDSCDKMRVEIRTTNSTTNEDQKWIKTYQAEIVAQGTNNPSPVAPYDFDPIYISKRFFLVK